MKNAEKNIKVVGLEGEVVGYAENNKEATRIWREYLESRR